MLNNNQELPLLPQSIKAFCYLKSDIALEVKSQIKDNEQITVVTVVSEPLSLQLSFLRVIPIGHPIVVNKAGLFSSHKNTEVVISWKDLLD